MAQVLKDMYTRYDSEGNKIQKNPEQKQYLLLLYLNDQDDDEYRTWELITGRSNVIEYLMDRYYDIEFSKSMIIVSTLSIQDNQPLLKFVQYCLDREFIKDEDQIKILETILSDYDEEGDDNDD